MENFLGYHSEWNLGSPGGWDYQRTTQEIAKMAWERLNQCTRMDVDLDFDHPYLQPVNGFAEMLAGTHRRREGRNPGCIAVVAEEETLEDVTENINLARRLDSMEGITGILAAPHEFELRNGRTCHTGRPVSLIFMDFNNDVFLKLHRKHNLNPLLQAIRDNRVLNPRGTEPFNVKSMFEVITDKHAGRFHRQTVNRTPWTRRFAHRNTTGPQGETIKDLVEWTRANWEQLVLKPARGYSGIGVQVGSINKDVDAAIEMALAGGNYILQEKVALGLWAEEMPELDENNQRVVLKRRQTDFRCFVGPDAIFGFLARYGDVPTNVGSGGGIQPIGILRSDIHPARAVKSINAAIANTPYERIAEIVAMQRQAALDRSFTYLLGPIEIPLRPRIVTPSQLSALEAYSRAMWADCLTLETMWQDGELDEYIDIEAEELEIARMQPWQGGPAIFAADGLFSFGAHLEDQ